MAEPKDTEFFQAYSTSRSHQEVKDKLSIDDHRNYLRRIKRYETRNGPLPSFAVQNSPIPIEQSHLNIQEFSGTLVVFSDAHFRESAPSDAFLILLQLCEKLKPEYIVNNGDAFDGASVSRFPRLGWEPVPSVLEELKSTKSALEKIKNASPGSKPLWFIGNHEQRLSNYLSNNAAMFEGMEGFKIEDHFKDWPFYISASLNDILIIKHRVYSGMHASYNNTLKSGMSIVTGHTHRLNIRPFSDYRGVRYGIETGTLARPYGPQFNFMESNTRDWQEGFVVITIKENQIYPELVPVVDGKAFFRGELFKSGRDRYAAKSHPV